MSNTILIALFLIIGVIAICVIKEQYVNVLSDSETNEIKEGYYPYYGRYRRWYPYYGYNYMPWYYYPLTPYVLW